MATIRDVADAAGLPIPTVARILRGETKGRWASARERTARVLKLAQELGYRPNLAAKAVATGKTHAITLVITTGPTGKSTLHESLVRNLASTLEARHYHLNMAIFSEDELLSEEALPHFLQASYSDGFLINFNKNIPPELPACLERQSLPWLWLNYKYSHNAVYPDDFMAGQTAARYLLDLGHRQVAYFNAFHTPADAHYSEYDRQDGFCACVQETTGVSARLIQPLREKKRDGLVGHLYTILQAPDRPTAICTYSETSASIVIAAAFAAGLKIPDDLSIITFGEKEAFCALPLTAVRIPLGELGQDAVSILLQRIENPQTAPQPSRVLPVKDIIYPGSSVAPPPGC
ncbi:MAG: LacI family transcriptional regulator [Lentisphaerae bacterium]|nr:MAG: LacI family transcriptional regulator [Lentisphaerota bacterium]